MTAPSPLISAENLQLILGDAGLKVLDASWHMPAEGRDARAEFSAGHIPGAVFFDIDAASDPDTDLPHMLPSPAQFAAFVGKIGVSDDDFVIAYDVTGLFSAARVWWMFRAMGHEKVRVLDGGLPAWRALETPLATGELPPAPADFTQPENTKLCADHHDVRRALADGDTRVLDARGAPRFSGAEADPRPGIRACHMPGAGNLHYAELLEDDGRMKSADALRALFEARDAGQDRRVIATCGSGVTAAIIALARQIAFGDDANLYDGSWAEWGRANNAPSDFPVTSV